MSRFSPGVAIGFALAASGVSGCFGPALPAVSCGDGNICPDDLVCRLPERICVPPAADAAVLVDAPIEPPVDAPPPGVLIDRGLLVRFFIDEADSGTSPMFLGDAAADPIFAPIAYLGNVAFLDTPAGRSLRWTNDGGPGGAATPIGGGKLANIDGQRRLTYEVVTDITAVADDGGALLHIGENVADASLVATPDGIQVRYDGNSAVSWSLSHMGRHVFHAVFDSTLNGASNRLRLYIDGVLLSDPSGDLPLGAATVNVEQGSSLAIGNTALNAQSVSGSIGYAAIYTEALDATEVAANAARLIDNDDG